MERLTKRDTDGQAMMDCQKCEADWAGKHGKPMAYCTALYCRNRLKDRLAAYEDRECAPEEVLPIGGYIVQTKYTKGQSKKFHAVTIKGHCTAKFVARLLGGIRIRPCIILTFSSPRTTQKNLQSIKKQTLTMCSPCVWDATTMCSRRVDNGNC